ncbi:CDP-Glycerol:Poly(glycerophosphate) glycerophosphotransferase [Flavobacterium fluvii]|uniref:CDP-Glycerol:Poly(Glycerophosphate) glycerophosphotransferase n=1 Tax=Flavobacterium fluvii TaxID=468056 RepID=A0A1M5J6S2_9FLAO|nr:CDP-glycerol glycerophosphotransferase family protein [Flavobacterium fluvii]SHG35703.1 CDP-Glycerol:Poly(glycerophosphate) glycerophosphotransferase [Flavobacterium fluvii]
MKNISELVATIKRYVPTKVWGVFVKVYGLIYYNHFYNLYLIKKAPARHRKALEKVRKKEKIKVAFFLIHESVWKYDLLFNLMLKHPRLEPIIFVCPAMDYGMKNMLFEMDKTFESFKSKGYDVIKTFDIGTGKYLDVKKNYSPDIIFYTNPYSGLQGHRFFIKRFPKTLTCYVPYAVMTTNYEFFYNLDFHNLVWKIFSETPIHKKIAVQKQRKKGRNHIVTGYPGFDQLLINKNPKDVWENKNPTLKKIIWAPHHSMTELNKVSNFLEYYDLFLELADSYSDKLQIAFKPHPLLRVKLEKDSNWGKEKTDMYYNKWINLENGQFENAEYADLFLTSDALIHDCGSFMSEYLITGKPSLFMVRNESVMEDWSEFGIKAVSAHYQSRNKKQLIDFIEGVVLNEKDWMKEERNTFVQSILIPKNKLTASENILHYLESQIFQ